MALMALLALPGAGARRAAAPSRAQASPAPAGVPAAAPTLGRRAYDYTRDVVAFGQRTPGSPGHARAERFILDHLAADAAVVKRDPYTAHTPRGAFAEENLIAKFGPTTGPDARRDIIIFCGHYDTKFLPHFVGADDGGSSTGLLLALADSLRGRRLKAPIWIAFLDGEEAVNREWSDNDDHTYGSRHWANELQAEGIAPDVRALILVDMIGDRGVAIQRDTNSTAWLEEFVGAAARRLGYASHFFATSMAIDDDHQPFLAVGIPCVDIIDLSYRFWHTPQDTLDKLSPESFQIVGAVVLKTAQMLRAQS